MLNLMVISHKDATLKKRSFTIFSIKDDLRQKIAYKAQLAGVPVYTVNAAYTSQTCHLCGHRERKNRRSQSEFSCQKCGAQCHADINVAINIASRGAVNLPNGVQLKLF
jgi:transposase